MLPSQEERALRGGSETINRAHHPKVWRPCRETFMWTSWGR